MSQLQNGCQVGIAKLLIFFDISLTNVADQLVWARKDKIEKREFNRSNAKVNTEPHWWWPASATATKYKMLQTASVALWTRTRYPNVRTKVYLVSLLGRLLGTAASVAAEFECGWADSIEDVT